MWQRFSLYDIRVIGHYLGVLVLFSTIALLVPLATAIACGEWEPASPLPADHRDHAHPRLGPAFPAHRARPASAASRRWP